MTDTTNTNTTKAAALAVRNAAAALARRRPLYDGASGEPADEDLAQAIEDLPLPDVDVTDVDVTDWRAEAERLRGLLRHEQQERHAVLDRLDAAILARTASQAQAEQYLAELQQARELRRERDELSEQVAFTARHLAIISGVLGSPEPIEIDDIAARLHLLIAERNALAARLEAIERAEPVAWMHADRRMAGGWAPRSARAENFVGWSPLIYIPGVAQQPPAAEPLPTIRLGRYRHYKGGEYRVLGVVRHSESLEPMVLYRSLGDGGDWVRPFGMFFETVEHEGRRAPRFELLDDGPARPCRTRGPEGCSDSTACPREGGAA